MAPPVDFAASETVVWKQPLPGKGGSSPIVVGNRVFVTCYSGYGVVREHIGEMKNLLRHVLCFDKCSGELIWQREFEPYLPEDPFVGKGLPLHGYASSTPVSDGKHIFLFFGKSGIIALDLNGQTLWKKSVGTGSGEFKWGSGASPIMSCGVLIVNASEEAETLFGLNPETGEELWKFVGVRNTWGTPVQVGSGASSAVVLGIPKKLLAVSPQTGLPMWYTTNGPIDTNVSASPVAHDESVLFIGSRARTAVLVRHSHSTGQDVTETHTVWESVSKGQITTPLTHQNEIYYVSEGQACCQSLENGSVFFAERLPFQPRRFDGTRPSNVGFGSPVMALGCIYYVTQSGFCYVFRAGHQFNLLKVNELSEDQPEFNATPAISGSQIFIRSNSYLYGIGKR